MINKIKKPRERIVAENISEVVWLRLKRLTSFQLCRKIIERRTTGLSAEVIDQKAKGMAWAIRSAMGYWDTKSAGLNSKILSRYYALLQISIAEQIASNDSLDNLSSIQRHTEHGHGLFTLQKSDAIFPEGFMVGCLKFGHFSSYCKNIGIDLSSVSFGERPRTISKVQSADIPKLISLYELLRRVPELQTFIPEYLGVHALSFQIGHAQRNLRERHTRMKDFAQKTGEVVFDPPRDEAALTTHVAIYPHSVSVNADILNGFGFPIKNICKEENDSFSTEDYYVGELTHEPPSHNWWNYLDTYKSGYCGTSIMVPFWGMNDIFLLHLIILYAFSIIVRYLPEQWHDIEDGENDHIRALLEHYTAIVDNVLPEIVIERLTGVELYAVQPGSMNAPV